MTTRSRTMLAIRCCMRHRWARVGVGVLGLGGGLACSLSMALAAAGVVGGATSAAGAVSQGSLRSGMSAMGSSGPSTPGVMRFLIDHGPTMLIVSIVLVTLAVAVRRPLAGIGAALVGVLLYWAMYGQSSITVMDVVVAIGLLAWGGLLAIVRRSAASTARSS